MVDTSKYPNMSNAPSVHNDRYVALQAARLEYQKLVFAVAPDTGHAPGHTYKK